MLRLVHFLHIGKTGGSAIKDALRPLADSHRLVLHPHTTRLWDVPDGDGVFFFLRDPVARFVSGFNSRLRQGQPRLNSKWNEPEAKAFAIFDTPNALAEALSAPDPETRARAAQAMRGIRHVNSHFSDWLRDEDYLQSRIASIVHIGFQESLAADFESLCAKLDLPQTVLPVDAHATPSSYATGLSELGARNIAAWYRDDRAWIDRLREHPATLGGAG